MIKDEIRRLLQSGSCISGQELAGRLGVSRTAVWKAIKQLQAEGCVISAVSNRGYQLLEMPERYCEEEIRAALTTQQLAKSVVFLEETGSTNTDCKRLLSEGAGDGLLVAAANQSTGKGRRGRSWESPKNTSVSFTIGLRPDLDPAKASMLTLVMALAVRDAVREVTGLSPQIKWPNDLILDGKKICGILTEMNLELGLVDSVIIGVGINVSQETFPEAIRDTATSLLLEKRKTQSGENGQEEPISRAQLTAACINRFEEEYQVFLKTGDISKQKQRYETSMVNKDRQVRVLDPKGSYEGVSLGITDTGELLVRREDGVTEKVYAGEVSVRGVYGYV